jgi:ribose transport system permease protein
MAGNKKSLRGHLRSHLSDITAYGGLALCILVFSFTSDGRLWSAYNIGLLLQSACVYSIISLGAVFVYAMGCMDISVGAQVGVYALIMAIIINSTGNVLLAFAVILVINLAAGAFNGAVAVWFRLPSIITSVFLMFIFGGVQFNIVQGTGSTTISVTNKAALAMFGNMMSTPVIAAAIIIVLLAAFYLFNFTRLGHYVKGIGSNETVVAQSGVNTTEWKVIAYMVYGVCVAVGSFFMLARTGSAGRGTGSGYAMDIMLCLILGGMPLSGGMKSRVRSALLGSFTYVLLSNGLILSNVNLILVNFIKALIFLAIIIISLRDKSGYLPR